MRLLLVNVFFAPQMVGGATRVVADNVKDFSRSGAFEEIGVFCSLKDGTPAHTMRCYPTDEATVFSVAPKSVPNADFLLSDPGMRARFSAVLDQFQPDVIHFHCIQRLTTDIVMEAADREIPYFITMHDGWWISDRQFLVNEAGSIETYDYNDPEQTRQVFGDKAVERQFTIQRALQNCAGILAVSDPFRRVLEDCAGLRNVRSVPNGSHPVLRLPKLKSEKMVIGYLAGIAHYKGYDQLRSAVTRGSFRNLKLLIVDHSLRKNEAIIETWGQTEVERVGFIPQDEVATLYQRLHAVIVPSVWPESYGLVAREALSAGCWLLASNRGAAGEDVVSGQNGYVFDPRDRDEFQRILAHLDQNSQTHKIPPEAVDIRSPQAQAEDLIQIYTEAVHA